MTIATITREGLIRAVNGAIREAGIRDTDAAMLRSVARHTKRVARGDYTINGIGCPFVQAGGSREDKRVFQFCTAFDRLTSSTEHEPGVTLPAGSIATILEVED